MSTADKDSNKALCQKTAFYVSPSWVEGAWKDYLYWQDTDKKILKRINRLVSAIARDPFIGFGDPEPLKHQWSEYWSRRINREHRLVYKSDKKTIVIVQCRYHY